MTNPKQDDLEAVRVLATTLEPFNGEERERIIRWARERLGMTGGAPPSQDRPPALPVPDDSATKTGTDIKTFVNEKGPKSDTHFAATVAYYHQFIAPVGQRKDSITQDDLVEACRQVPRKRPARPAQVLVNAYSDGILDRGTTGHYKLNSVGENLVSMTLPGRPNIRAERKKVAKARGRRLSSAKAKAKSTGTRKRKRN
jgi:hypothetical protein